MNTLSNEDMVALTQAVISHLDDWNIDPADILTILGLADDVAPRHLSQYRQGMKALPQTEDMMQRIDHLVGIADALRTTFPFSHQMRVMWLQKPHRRFQKRSPLAIMLEEGTEGMMRVRIEVDCAYGYAINDALQAQAKQAAAAV